MNKEKEEYISLRQEILDLCASADRIINILYLFLAPYLCFAFEQKDTIYILAIHVIIIPLYLLVIDRRIATCRASAYILVFHEEEGNKWETRLINFKNQKEPMIFKKFSSKHFSFIFANFTGMALFICKTKWEFPIPAYEIVKILIESLLFILTMYIFIKYQKIQTDDYIQEWENIRAIAIPLALDNG